MPPATRTRVASAWQSSPGTMSAISMGATGDAVAGVASVLFTFDHRVFFMDCDSKIRAARDWERDEVLLQLLSWRDSGPRNANRS